MPSEPKRKSWSNFPIRCALRSMWNSLPCHSVCATAWEKESPLIVSWANSGLSPTMSGRSSDPMKARACPTVGSRMSPRGSFGFGSRAMRRLQPAVADVLAARGRSPLCTGRVPPVRPSPPRPPSPPGLPRARTPRAPSSAPELDRLARLLHGEPSYSGVVGGEGTLLEDGAPEQVGRHHRDVHAGRVERAAEPLDDVLPLRWRRAVGHEVVVVEADAVGAEVGQPVDGVDRVEGGAHHGAEGVPPWVSDGPQAEGEVVLGSGGEGIGHGPPVAGTPPAVHAPTRPDRVVSRRETDDSVIRNGVMGERGRMRAWS